MPESFASVIVIGTATLCKILGRLCRQSVVAGRYSVKDDCDNCTPQTRGVPC
jgi:hypothetical protein